MASLTERAVVLSFSRFANQAIVLLSPILLVRILPIAEYGSYREFILYASVIAPFVTFGVRYSLIYFLPKYPDRESVWITQSALFVFALSSVAVIILFVAGDFIRDHTSFDLVGALQIYVLFFLNLDFLESYWLGRKRTDYVLFLSAGRLVARLLTVVIAALFSRDAHTIVISLIILEATRCLLVFSYAWLKRWFTLDFSRDTIREQLTYSLPLGAGGLVDILNTRTGMVFVSVVLGAESLAFYVIGAFATQVVNVLRGAIADVIFPEIVELRHAEPKDALPLWQRATVLYCALLFPVATLLGYYADAVVTILFTAEYSPAIPVFSTFAFSLLILCFDFHLPIRVRNKNRYFLVGNLIALSVTLVAIWPLYVQFGILGPAFATLASRAASVVYLARQASRLYDVGAAQIVKWREVGMVALAVVVCIPILFAGKLVTENLFVRAFVFGPLFAAAYGLALGKTGVWNPLNTLRSLGRASVRLISRSG